MPTSLALYVTTVCICNICVCVCIYINAYLFLNITLSFHNVTCMYIFRNDHLALTNNWCAFSLGKNISLNPSFSQLLIVLCVGLRSHGIFPHPLMHVQKNLSCLTDVKHDAKISGCLMTYGIKNTPTDLTLFFWCQIWSVHVCERVWVCVSMCACVSVNVCERVCACV